MTAGATVVNKSPLAPAAFPDLPAVAGVRLATLETGVKYHGRDDLLLAVVDQGAAAAGVLTKSTTPGAPVVWCRERLQAGNAPRALLVNAGNANTFTGANGARHVYETCAAAAKQLGCRPEQVLAASTGVIGEPLPVKKIIDSMPRLAKALAANSDSADSAAPADSAAWSRAAAAILTTDTFAKGATATAAIDGVKVTINGIAKGSGMIEPDMATMLAFVFTDAAVEPPALDACLRAAVAQSFHCITVDGDTSTSDTVLLFATGAAANRTTVALDDFQRALNRVCADLAVQVVRDGEGASKLITVQVRGGEDDAAAQRIAKCIANSPLVKTAIAGGDANWGRVVMAAGKSGQRLDPSRLRVAIGGVTVAAHGARVDDYNEAPLNQHLRGDEVLIEVDAGVGDGRACVWTCDLTRGYIDINADYRS
ncbi:MAG: bifunctional glutamate N-acetyltransferase/amino-acid acetyltransferase ArgJ [Gammaproteobacteria bacterium]|nr:bifunctional glutamate N-acetyltransferase/amino-acid acetyltransferase ArgJ [Gammaproteobacteria bacterium]